ncbi:hypothetical protein N7478_000192 [Penicillium angulare]|uniref:uncharacterized protein n=1 Tax=Penicillium angulare TaxID=116970 RepID=UPI00253F6D31|nr:uncharacterized protein N7478_000192 [Penicillium angulare]KAJ5290941.1 hypothetical protein N7478_000192 [Penicillium angulare]
MQLSLFVGTLFATLITAMPAPNTETQCLNEFATCEVHAPHSSPHQCCIGNMVCEPWGGFKSNSTMGTCIKQNDI